MLREVGSRAVNLESSEPPAPPRSAPKPEVAADPPARAPQTVAPARARRATTTRRPSTRGDAARVRSRAAAADAFTASVRATPALPEGVLLSLDDDVPASSEPCLPRPWTRGLRG